VVHLYPEDATTIKRNLSKQFGNTSESVNSEVDGCREYSCAFTGRSSKTEQNGKRNREKENNYGNEIDQAGSSRLKAQLLKQNL